MVFTTNGYVEITRQFILDRVSELDIFKYYIPNFKSLNCKFSSPFRKDKDPSCSIKDYGDGLIFRDFATGENYSPVKLVQALYGCDYNTTLKRIATDLGILNLKVDTQLVKQRLAAEKTTPTKDYSKIFIKIREWNNTSDRAYWSQYGISRKTLDKYKVFPLTTYWLNSIRTDCKTPSYAYYFGNNEFKILNPYAESYKKWLSNCRYSTMQGYNQLPAFGDLLVITSSLKDCMLLSELGYVSVAPQAESYLIPSDIITELKSRFKKVILFYDNDGEFEPLPGTSGKGKHGAKKNSIAYGLDMIFLPEGDEKDISDYYKTFGKTATLQIINTLINGST